MSRVNLSLSERKVTFQISACFGHQSGNDYLILTFSSLYTGTDAGVSWMWSQSIFLSCIPLYSFILMYVDSYKSSHSMCDMLQWNLEKKNPSLEGWVLQLTVGLIALILLRYSFSVTSSVQRYSQCLCCPAVWSAKELCLKTWLNFGLFVWFVRVQIILKYFIELFLL